MKWKCGVCGYIHDGDDAPDKCPKCGADKSKFIKLEAKDSDLVQRARYSNQLHCDLMCTLDNVVEISEEGIEDNLDPTCIAIFQKAKEQAAVLKQMIKAEIAGHISKGKWG